MYRDVTFASGVLRASLLAGPIFLAVTLLFTAIETPAPLPVSPQGLGLLLLAIFAVPFGAPLALLPTLLGTALLARVAASSVGLRLPAAWALVGGGVAGGAAMRAAAEPTMIAAFAATGAICALLCRSGTHWPD